MDTKNTHPQTDRIIHIQGYLHERFTFNSVFVTLPCSTENTAVHSMWPSFPWLLLPLYLNQNHCVKILVGNLTVFNSTYYIMKHAYPPIYLIILKDTPLVSWQNNQVIQILNNFHHFKAKLNLYTQFYKHDFQQMSLNSTFIRHQSDLQMTYKTKAG